MTQTTPWPTERRRSRTWMNENGKMGDQEQEAMEKKKKKYKKKWRAVVGE